jgi:hypothetical protein
MLERVARYESYTKELITAREREIITNDIP